MACDEVGPMELLSPEFRREVRLTVLETEKPAVCVVHKRYEDPLIKELKESGETSEFEITFENRDTLPIEISEDIISLLQSSESGSARKFLIIAGVDDAGRGSVLGPLVIAGISVDESKASRTGRNWRQGF